MLQLIGNNYLLRTPLYPIQFADKAYGQEFENEVKRDEFQYGLYLSSKDFFLEYQKQQKAGVLDGKARLTLRKYWLRASSRCTPYANLAGCSLGSFGTATNIIMGAPAEHREACRLDMNLIHKLLELIDKDEALKQQLIFYPNNTLYALAGRYRYVRYKIKHHKRHYFLSEAEFSPYLKKVMEAAAPGKTLSQLADMLEAEGFDREEEALPYLYSLLENQILSSELEPCVSGEQPFEHLAGILKKYPSTQHYANLINNIHALLNRQHFNVQRLEEVLQMIEQASIDRTGVGTPFQSDLYKHTASNTINQRVVQQILKEINTLMAATYANKKPSEQLQQFKEKFYKRYEMQEVPLCEALDVEFGIGYGNYSNNVNTLISDLPFESDAGKKQEPPLITQLKRMLQERSSIADDSPVVLTDKDLPADEPGKEQLSYTLRQYVSVMGSLYGKNAEAIDKGDYQFLLRNVGGPSTSNLLARFCHIDEAVGKWVTGLTFGEEQSLPDDTVYAEIIHLPQERIGNILLRPVLRSYEIPYQGNAGADTEKQIPVSDLLIAIRNNQVVLRSKTLNKYVIPRLTTAHNYSMDSLPMYKFLCDLQHQQNFGGFGFDHLLEAEAVFTPRITYKHLILKRASWKLFREDVLQTPGDDEALKIFIEEFRRKRKLPQQIMVQQGDNELLVDLQYLDAFRLLAATVDKYKVVQVVEFLGQQEIGAVGSPMGNYCNEIVFPAFIEKAAVAGRKAITANNSRQPQRSFFPGDEWLYLKLYGSGNTIETLLAGPIKKLVNTLMRRKLIKSFFFLRYADPDTHIRIRFRLINNSDFLDVITAVRELLSKYLNNKMITGLQIDTYVREIERYGGPLIVESESIFYHDSWCVLNLLQHLHTMQLDEKRWHIGLIGIDEYLNEFGYDLAAKIRLLTYLQKSFFTEFAASQVLHHGLNDKYREMKDSIFQLFKEKGPAELDTCRKLFSQRNLGSRAAVRKIREALQKAARTPDDLLSSYLHMFIIRLFVSDNRRYELALYHLLLKYYQSVDAMQKGVGKEKREEKKPLQKPAEEQVIS